MIRHAVSMVPFALGGSLGKRTLVARTRRRVRLSECDFNMHMNQAAYAHIAELARMGWAIGAGVVRQLLKTRVKPVVAEQRIVYRRELKPGQRYAIDTRATGFDGRLFEVDVHMLVGERVHTAVYGKLLLIGSKGVLGAQATQEILGEFVTDPLPIDDWRVVE